MNTRKPRFGCDFCSKRCSTETGLRVHKRAMHLTEGVLCPYCSVILPSNLLAEHVTSCKAVDVNTSDALLYYGYSGMEENFLDDLPSRLTSLRHVAVDWDSLVAHSRPEPVESESSPIADYAPYTVASDDDYAEPLGMVDGDGDGDDDDDRGRSEKEKHAAEVSETSPVSEAENLRVGWKKSSRHTRSSSLNRSSLSALQRMLGVKRMLQTLKPSSANSEKTEDAAPASAGPTKARAKRGPDKRMTGKPRKKARLSKKVELCPGDDHNGNVDIDLDRHEENEEAGKGKRKKKAAKEILKDFNDDDNDDDGGVGNLVIDLDAQTDSSSVKEALPQKSTDGKMDRNMAKRVSQRRKYKHMMKQMKDLVDKSEKVFTEEKSESKKAKSPSEASTALASKIDLDSSDDTEGKEIATVGRRCKSVAKKKIKNVCINDENDDYTMSSDLSSVSDVEQASVTSTSRKKKVVKRTVKQQKPGEMDVDFKPDPTFTSDSDASCDSGLSINGECESHKMIDDEYDSDYDFGPASFDRSLIQSTIPCPLSTSPVVRANTAEMIGAPFASLFLCFIVDPKGGDISPPLPDASSLPIVRYENEEDDMRSFMWVCECCGLVKNSREKKESHVRAVHFSCIVHCPFCRVGIPFSLYAVHTWLLCRKIQRLYPPSLFSSQDLSGPRSFPCELCNAFFVTTCPLYYLRHVITFHSKIVNALAMERVECSRCHGFFHKAFISVHEFICQIASEMGIPLPNLASYHVDVIAAGKLGRPLPSIQSPQQKVATQSPPKVTRKKYKTKVHLPQKPRPSKDRPQIAPSKFFLPVNLKTSKDRPTASNPRSLDNDVMEIVDIPSSPEPQKDKKVKSQTKVAGKKKQRKHVSFSSIFLENIFEPSSPPSSPRPDDTLEVDVGDLSKDSTLEDSVCTNGPGNDNLDLNINESANVKLQESHNGRDDDRSYKQNGVVGEEVIFRTSNEVTEACSNTDHATVMTIQEQNDDSVSNQDQQLSGVMIEKKNEKGESEQDRCVIEASKKDDENEVVIVDVKMYHKKNICEFCGKGADLVPELQAHKQKHKGGVRCPLCLTLLPRSLLLCHRRLFCPTLHKNVTWSLQCDLCQKAIPSPFHLLRHALDWHSKHVTKTPGERPAIDEPMRQRCEHCAAPVRPIFFDCHQEMCFRKLQFEMKARPLVKKVPPASNDAEAPDGPAISTAAEVPSGTDASDSSKVVGIAESSDTVDIVDGAPVLEAAEDNNISTVADSLAVADAPKTAEVACDGEYADSAGPADAPCNTVTIEAANQFEDPELVGVSNTVRRSESDDAAPIAVSNGFEAGLATPPHIASEDAAANSNLDQGAMDCGFSLLMEDSVAFGTGSSSNSLRMSSTPPEQREAGRLASFEREVNGEGATALSATASDAVLFEDISEVLEAVMHENGQQNQL